MTLHTRALAFVAVFAASAVAISPESAAAQSARADKGKGRSAEAHADQGKGRKGEDRDDRYQTGRRQGAVVATRASKGKNGNGPAFCRSGAGHPVQGRSWCVEKGFGLGSDRWDRARWGNVVFGRDTRRSGNVTSGTLSDILGSVIYGRLQSQAGYLGGGSLAGRWINSSEGPLVLQVQAGSRPLAEFLDRNRDGRADVILLNLGR